MGRRGKVKKKDEGTEWADRRKGKEKDETVPLLG